MKPDERNGNVFVDFSHATDAGGNALPDDAGMPHAGNAATGNADGDDIADAARRAAGADPALSPQEQDLSSLAGELPPAD